MSTLSTLKRAAIAGLLALSAASASAAPGCVGKMWNPLTDLDFTLMGGIKVGPMKLMGDPKILGTPPKHQPENPCSCKDGLNTGIGIGLTFWLPAYINDVARQAGCIGFLGGVNVLPGFISESSSQEYNHHSPRREGVTNMQIHWAYADVTALAGKSLFERCGAQNSAMSISYMTEVDFVFQNDVYSVIMTPQAAILAAVPILSQMTCGAESIANTLGGWQDSGVCAWKGSRLPLSANSQSKDMAQVTNMDVTIKYLTRSALLGTQLRTMGSDVVCKPKYSPFYDPFQHRYQWSFPNKVATRYNMDAVRWGMFVKNGESSANMMQLSDEAAQVAGVDSTIKMGSGEAGAGTPANLGLAQSIVAKLPKPLNYPTKEAGFMQVWEARQCCIMILTVQNIINMMVGNFMESSAQLKQLYEFYNTVSTAYKFLQDPIGGALGMLGDQIASSIGGAASGISNSISNLFGGKGGGGGGGG